MTIAHWFCSDHPFQVLTRNWNKLRCPICKQRAIIRFDDFAGQIDAMRVESERLRKKERWSMTPRGRRAKLDWLEEEDLPLVATLTKIAESCPAAAQNQGNGAAAVRKARPTKRHSKSGH